MPENFVSETEIDQWEKEAFTKYGLVGKKINKTCPAKTNLLKDKDGYVKISLREAFPELLLEEMYGLTTEQILNVITPDLEN